MLYLYDIKQPMHSFSGIAAHRAAFLNLMIGLERSTPDNILLQKTNSRSTHGETVRRVVKYEIRDVWRSGNVSGETIGVRLSKSKNI